MRAAIVWLASLTAACGTYRLGATDGSVAGDDAGVSGHSGGDDAGSDDGAVTPGALLSAPRPIRAASPSASGRRMPRASSSSAINGSRPGSSRLVDGSLLLPN